MRTRISTRLGLGFAAMLLLVVATAVVAIVNLNRMGQSMGMLARQADQAAALGSIRAGALNAQASLLIALEERSSGVLLRASILLDNLNDQISDYEHPKDAEGTSMAARSASNPGMAQSCGTHCHVGPSLTALEENRVAFTEAAQGYITQAADRPVSLPAARARMDTIATAVLQATDGLAKEERASLERVQAELVAIQSSTQTLMLVSAITAAVLGLLLALTITRSITVPLAKLVSLSDKISTGELDTPVPVAAKDEIGELAESMERMRISIKALIERMRSRSGG
jgi:HAMP domain-containing protein